MHPYPRRWGALAVLCLAVSIVTIDTTILNAALPTLSRELDAGTGELQWIVEAFVLVLAALLLTAGAIADRIGRRRMLVVGTGVFAAASLLAAAADSAGELIAARALMGLGAATIMPSTLSTIRSIFDGRERTRAIAIWTAAASLGIGVGPVLGGVLLEAFDWGAVFLVNVPVAAAVVAGALLLVPETRDPSPRRLDLPGTVLSAAALGTLVLALIEAPRWGWTAPETLGLFALAAGLLAAFVAWQRRTSTPMLPLSLFADRRFSVASGSLALAYLAVTGVLFAVTLQLQVVLGHGAVDAGLRLLPLSAGVLALAPFAEPAVRRAGTRLVIGAGLLVTAAGFGVLATLGEGDGYPPLAWSLLLIGAGMGLAAAAATESILSATPADRAGAGAAVDETAAEVGQALGVAVLGSALASFYAGGLALPDGVPAPAVAAAEDSVAGAAEAAAQLPAELGAAVLAEAGRAFTDALAGTALVGAAVCAAGAAVAIALLPGRAPAQRDALAVRDA